MQQLSQTMIILRNKNLWSNYSTRKKRGNILQIEKISIKKEHYKISKLLNDSTLSKFLKNGLK